MKWSYIECFIVCVFVILMTAQFLQTRFDLRFAGQNILNARLWAYMSIIVVVLGNMKILVSRPVIFCYFLLVIFFTFEGFGHYDLQHVSNRQFYMIESQLLPLVTAVILCEHFMNPKRLPQLKLIMAVALFAYIFEAILSIYLIFRYPAAVRGTEAVFAHDATYESMGLGDYSLVSSLPFLIPAMVFYIRDTITYGRNIRNIWLFALLIVLVYSYKAVLIAPFMIAIAGLVLAVLGRIRVLRNIWTILAIAFFAILIPRLWIADILYSLSDNMSNQEMKAKFHDIGFSLEEGIDLEADIATGNAMEIRASRIPLTLSEFIRNPLIGTGKVVDTHVYWFNLLAQFGIVGIVPLILVITSLKKKKSQLLNQDGSFYYNLTLAAFIMLGLLKAFTGFPIFITGLFIAPGIVYLTGRKRELVDEMRTSEIQPMKVIVGLPAEGT